MSDFELNKEIANQLFKNHLFTEENEIGSFVKVWRDDFGYCGEFVGKFDYCNNWSDMGPLIEEIWDELNKNVPERVGLNRYIDSTVWKRAMSEFECTALRAAAIVYILIKQVD